MRKQDSPAHHITSFARYLNRKEIATAAGAGVRSVIYASGVEREKLVEAPAVERQVFHLLLGDESGRGIQRGVHDGGFRSHRHLLYDVPYFQRQIYHRLLGHYEINS